MTDVLKEAARKLSSYVGLVQQVTCETAVVGGHVGHHVDHV